jgi:hypothetical protein
MRILCLIVLLCAAGCEAVFGPEPSATPTAAFPEVLPSPSPDIRFPTEIPDDVPVGDGVTLPQIAGLPANAAVSTEIALPTLARPNLISIPLRDGRVIDAEVYNGRAGALGVLLLGASFEAWGGLPVSLREAGYTVLTVGEAVEAAVLAEVFEVLAVQPDVSAGRLVVIGVGAGANAGLIGCATESRCVGAVVVSPADAPALTDAARAMGPRPMVLAVDVEDGASLATAEAVRQAAQAAELLPYEGAGRGVQLFANRPDFGQIVLAWLAAR